MPHNAVVTLCHVVPVVVTRRDKGAPCALLLDLHLVDSLCFLGSPLHIVTPQAIYPMVLPSPSIPAGARLAYWVPEGDQRQDLDAETAAEEHVQQDGTGNEGGRKSMYVELFECRS